MIVIVCKYTVTPLPADNFQSTFIHEESEDEHEGKERKVAPGGLSSQPKLPLVSQFLSPSHSMMRRSEEGGKEKERETGNGMQRKHRPSDR